MPHTIRISFIIAAIALAGNAIAAGKVADPSKFVTKYITVSGAVEQKLTLRVDDLKAFPPRQNGKTPIICMSGANKGNIESMKGVLLRDILEKAKVIPNNPGDGKKTIITATSSDGYKAVFSWNEIFDSPVSDGVIVYFERDGKPLGNKEGRIAMISTKDIRTGPRHVNWLKEIEVSKIDK
jgi:DMSO/TMAO reductase YedYZ molybdopterin-dependent catalytic subunit